MCSAQPLARGGWSVDVTVVVLYHRHCCYLTQRQVAAQIIFGGEREADRASWEGPGILSCQVGQKWRGVEARGGCRVARGTPCRLLMLAVIGEEVGCPSPGAAEQGLST